MWWLIAKDAAEIMGLTDRGRLEPGLRADLVVVEAASRRIEATVSGGRLTYLSGEAARRFLAQPRIVSAFEEGNQRAAE